MKDIAHNAIEAAWGDFEMGGAIDTQYSTKDYIVAIGFPDNTAESEGRLYYLVVNKVTGVIEYSTSLVVEARLNMENFQAVLDKYSVVEAEMPEPVGAFN